MADEKRQVERIRLQEPLAAFINNRRVWIVDLGLLGCRIEHNHPLDAGQQVTMLFHWGGDDITIDCAITRCEVQPLLMDTREISIYHSGIEFGQSSPNTSNAVRRIVAAEVMRILDAQKANARGEIRTWAKDVSFFAKKHDVAEKGQGGKPVYLMCRLDKSGQWNRVPVYKANQPPDGFTVAADTPADEIETLIRSYAEGNAEARHLIRVCAELSLLQPDDAIPPGRFRKS
ncbi:MAG: hypothetical protein ACYC7A_14305 [Thermoanaerobaculia bacterium]